VPNNFLSVYDSNFFSLQTFRSLLHGKLHVSTLIQTPISGRVDRGEVHEYVLPVFALNEAKPLLRYTTSLHTFSIISTSLLKAIRTPFLFGYDCRRATRNGGLTGPGTTSCRLNRAPRESNAP